MAVRGYTGASQRSSTFAAPVTLRIISGPKVTAGVRGAVRRAGAGGAIMKPERPLTPIRPVWSCAVLEHTHREDRTEVTFVLPAETPPGPVSVVGDFNAWTPGAHELRPRPDGTRAVTVALPAKASHSFRYLAAGDYWFNDEAADGHHDGNSRLTT